jgi:thiosulfate/3-mercaptopyruvate sulfurtransferase
VFTPRIIAAAVTAQTGRAGQSEFANPELLAETDWLAERLDDPSIRIVDCDEFPAYQRLHIKNAIGLRVHHYLKGEDDTHLMGPEQFAETMSRHGIGSEHTVVAYDGMGGLYAARLWWALDRYGHKNAKVLNGGFEKWFAEGRPVTREQSHVERARFEVRPGSDNLCGIDEIREAMDRGDTVVWDVRSRGEHTGEDPRQNKFGGHIPGAVHMEWMELTAPPARSGILLPPDEMRRKLEQAGITPEKRVLVH